MTDTTLSPLPTGEAPATTTMASALQSRESSQVEVAMISAKRFPRDQKAALDRILNSCSREALATQALYSFSRGGQEITGPSIRLAEAIAQQWGNIECGWREIDRRTQDGVGLSIIEAYAWDIETNTRVPRVFTVKHWRDTRKGGYALTDERDIYELCANQAARRLRACIQSVIPADVFEEAEKQCHVTLSASADTSPEALTKMIEAFKVHGVSKAQLEGRIQRRLESITAAQIVSLRKVINSLAAGMSEPSDWFDPNDKPPAKAVDPFAKKKESPKAEPPSSERASPADQGQKESSGATPAPSTSAKEDAQETQGNLM